MSDNLFVTVQDIGFTNATVQDVDLTSAVSTPYSSGSALVQDVDLSNAYSSTLNVNNPTTLNSLSSVEDVDASAKINGSVLVYKSTTSKWTATTHLDAQDMDGGEF